MTGLTMFVDFWDRVFFALTLAVQDSLNWIEPSGIDVCVSRMETEEPELV